VRLPLWSKVKVNVPSSVTWLFAETVTPVPSLLPLASQANETSAG
jgi:hypothetical protein